jgi:hypothetical protein
MFRKIRRVKREISTEEKIIQSVFAIVLNKRHIYKEQYMVKLFFESAKFAPGY